MTASSATTATAFRLYGRRLLVLRAFWLLAAVLMFIIFVGNLPNFYAQALAASERHPIAGLSPALPALFEVGQSTLFLFGFWAVSLLLFVRKPDDGIAYFVSLLLLLTGWMYAGMYLRHTPLLLVNVSLVALGETCQVIFFFTFPDGHFLPRWVRHLIPPLYAFRWLIWLNIYVNRQPQGAIEVGILGTLVLIGIGTQIYRFRRLATPIQRQQVKWLVIGASVAVLVVVPTVYLTAISEIVTYQSNFPLAILVNLVRNLALLSVPLALALSILRYRLWDIDLTINRSLVYSLVTLSLIAILTFGFFAMQRLFSSVFGVIGVAESGLALAASGLLTGILFNPIRHAARSLVDRRLYGFRFDLDQLDKAQQGAPAKPAVKNPSALTGRVLGGYEVLDVIGRGGMGEVYKGYRDGQIVAIKVIPTDVSVSLEILERFDREIRALKRLTHPNIVKIYDGSADHQPPYMAIEYVEGRTLRDYLRDHQSRKTQLPIADAHAIVKALTSALDYMHANGIVHRDLKPANILLRTVPDAPDGSFQVVLSDFGIAKLDSHSGTLTGAGAIGTIDYMAPEQIHMARDVDWRADIYALGVITFELLTGTRPFTGNPGQVLFGHLQQPPPDPRTVRTDLPQGVALAVRRALAKHPNDRYDTASDLVLAFEEAN